MYKLAVAASCVDELAAYQVATAWLIWVPLTVSVSHGPTPVWQCDWQLCR